MVVLNVLGLNCGTSIDGIDVALCRISSVPDSSDVSISLLSYCEVPVDPEIRTNVLRLCRPNNSEGAAATSLAELSDLNFVLGKEFARAVEQSGVDLSKVDLIASHGQTLWHQPLGEDRSTLQMAEPAVIAHKTRLTVASGFRVAELAAGRQGAPLSGFFEAGIFSDPAVTRISQNVGGMSNASVLPAANEPHIKADGSSYLAFDTGPGNVFIDAAMRILTNGTQHYDRDGAMGLKGEPDIDTAFVNAYLDNEPYFKLQPPKTTGRELFSDDVARSLVTRLQQSSPKNSPEAIIATITRITAESIARSYESFVLPLLKPGSTIDEVYLCGGGAYNPNILNHLRARLPGTSVAKLSDAPISLDPSAKEAVMFALLGFLCLCGRRVGVPLDAESKVPATLGVVTPGDNYHRLLRDVVLDRDFAANCLLGRIRMETSS